MSALAATRSNPALETHQNVRPLGRSTPRMALTDVGREYLKKATAVNTRRLHR
jgi:DNA-binding transcriptional LysR family regulator